MKERRDERLAATGRRDVQLTVAMEEDFDAIADVLESDDVSGEADAQRASDAVLRVVDESVNGGRRRRRRSARPRIGTAFPCARPRWVWRPPSRRARYRTSRAGRPGRTLPGSRRRWTRRRRRTSGREREARPAIRRWSLQRGDTVREQTLAARLEARVTGFLVKIDADAAATQARSQARRPQVRRRQSRRQLPHEASISAANPGPERQHQPDVAGIAAHRSRPGCSTSRARPRSTGCRTSACTRARSTALRPRGRTRIDTWTSPSRRPDAGCDA